MLGGGQVAGLLVDNWGGRGSFMSVEWVTTVHNPGATRAQLSTQPEGPGREGEGASPHPRHCLCPHPGVPVTPEAM